MEETTWLREVLKGIVRSECHRNIQSYLEDNVEKTNLYIAKEAETKHRTRKIKCICFVPRLDDAVSLKKGCEEIIANAKQSLKDLSDSDTSDGPIAYKITYKIKIISASGTMFLQNAPAERRRIITGERLLHHLDTAVNWQDTTEDLAAKRAFKKCIDPEKEYVLGESTGQSYRITYFDPEVGRRKQVNVGNILIAVGYGDVQDAPIRKTRTDRKEPVFTYGKYSVYE